VRAPPCPVGEGSEIDHARVCIVRHESERVALITDVTHGSRRVVPQAAWPSNCSPRIKSSRARRTDRTSVRWTCSNVAGSTPHSRIKSATSPAKRSAMRARWAGTSGAHRSAASSRYPRTITSARPKMHAKRAARPASAKGNAPPDGPTYSSCVRTYTQTHRGVRMRARGLRRLGAPTCTKQTRSPDVSRPITARPSAEMPHRPPANRAESRGVA
jgi:hypothetical protein